MKAQTQITSIDELLDRFRQAQSSTTEQGRFFEKLVCNVLLRSDYPFEFKDAWLWNDWKYNDGADNGIDVVMETESGEYWAVQCKFYNNKSVCKEDVDSFLAEGAKPHSSVSFSRLLLYATSPISANLKRELEGRTPPVFARRVDQLDDYAYNWDQVYRAATGEEVAFEDLRSPKKTLREHQQEALDAVKRGFETSDRGKLIMACGTGKTLTSLRIAETLAPPSGIVLYLVPSLALLAQTLREWTFEANRRLAPILVCSDAQISRQDSRRALNSTGKTKSKGKSQETVESDEPTFDPIELAEPASTDSDEIVARWQKIDARTNADKDVLTVVFSTYQSIQAISDAQRLGNASGRKLPKFDLIVCDEAHRTTGVSLRGKDESAFVKVHDDAVIAGKKRLYMTATPRVYGDVAQAKARESNAELCSMDDETIYGENFYVLSFGKAVKQGLLADYKVLILVVDEDYAKKYHIARPSVAKVAKTGKIEVEIDPGDVPTDDVAKMIGCWRGLNKRSKASASDQESQKDGFSGDPAPMKRAVAFCRSIKDSQEFVEAFKKLSELLVEEENKKRADQEKQKALKRLDAQGNDDENDALKSKSEEVPRIASFGDRHDEKNASLKVDAKHVDGTFPADARKELLTWLKKEPEENVCNVLSNVRCLAEGVDVPNLDSVLFLSPRSSQVDVIQAVGRVMRRPTGKKFGYVIIPIVVAESADASAALDANARYSSVWQTLQALRSHDDQFRILINQLQVGETTDKIVVEIVGGDGAKPDGNSALAKDDDKKSDKDKKKKQDDDAPVQGSLFLVDERVEQVKKSIYAEIVKRCGDRDYLDQWARDVAKITATRIDGIRAKLENPTDEQKQAFDALLDALRREINPNIGKEQALETVAQHLTTLPVFDALFADSAFSKNNPVAKLIKKTVDAFHVNLSEKERAQEERFQESVRAQIEGIKTVKGRQAVIHKLYEQFFAVALPKTAEKLGVVYTPPEVVDYILHSVDFVLRQEFDRRITDENVSVLDPFAGTGAFIARLIASGLIDPKDLRRKYRKELCANEIMPLAYYIAAANIEEAFGAAIGEGAQYEPFPGVVLTDTFQIYEGKPEPLCKIGEENPTNGDRLEKQRQTPIEVVVGNPPYSVGQKSGNDNNQNEKYPKLDARIAETYAAKSSATNKNSLYDSYIKAFRWASDRVKDEGVVAFVSNGGYVDAAAMEGFRKSLVEEFATIYVFNLRGNQRTQGETSRKEGGKIFGSGSRTPVAITILVKKPHTGNAKIYYRDIGDYLTRDQKLNLIKEFGSVENTEWTEITPNEMGDWINQRGDDFGKLIALGNKDAKEEQKETTFFEPTYSRGVATARDAWAYNFSRRELIANMSRMIMFYNNQVDDYQKQEEPRPKAENFVCNDGKKISWNRGLLRDLKNGKKFNESVAPYARVASYRPFCKEFLFFHPMFNDMVYRIPKLFPTPNTSNKVICVPGVGGTKEYSAVITDQIPDLGIESASQCFPLYFYESLETATILPNENPVIIDGYVRREAITTDVLQRCQTLYDSTLITKEDIFYYVYGALHSPSYRARYENELKKELARLPLPPRANFWEFSSIGRRLANIHLNYETGKSTIQDGDGKPLPPLAPWKLNVRSTAPEGTPDKELYRVVRKMKLGTKTELQQDGKTKKVFDGVLKYNDYLTFTDVPLESFQYVVNGRSPLEWLVERYYCKEDKTSGIVDDPNEWSDDPKYVFNLVPRLVAVAMETLKLTSSKRMPELE